MEMDKAQKVIEELLTRATIDDSGQQLVLKAATGVAIFKGQTYYGLVRFLDDDDLEFMLETERDTEEAARQDAVDWLEEFTEAFSQEIGGDEWELVHLGKTGEEQ